MLIPCFANAYTLLCIALRKTSVIIKIIVQKMKTFLDFLVYLLKMNSQSQERAFYQRRRDFMFCQMQNTLFLILSSFSERKQSFRENFVIQSINEKATGWVVKCCHRLIFYPLLGETFPHRQDSFTSAWRTFNQQLG